jgi:hypothetical protein
MYPLSAYNSRNANLKVPPKGMLGLCDVDSAIGRVAGVRPQLADSAGAPRTKDFRATLGSALMSVNSFSQLLVIDLASSVQNNGGSSIVGTNCNSSRRCCPGDILARTFCKVNLSPIWGPLKETSRRLMSRRSQIVHAQSVR